MPDVTRDSLRSELDALTMVRAVITQDDGVGVGIGLAYGTTEHPVLAGLLYSAVTIAARALLSAHGYDVKAALIEMDRKITAARTELDKAS